MNIGDRIKNRRKKLGLSAEQLAEILGVSPSTIYRYESEDIMNMRIDKVPPIAKALNTTASSLMGWDVQNEEGDISVIIEMLKDMDNDQLERVREYAELIKKAK